MDNPAKKRRRSTTALTVEWGEEGLRRMAFLTEVLARRRRAETPPNFSAPTKSEIARLALDRYYESVLAEEAQRQAQPSST